MMKISRTPNIMGDAAYYIFLKGKDCTGNFFIDDEVLIKHGITNLN